MSQSILLVLMVDKKSRGWIFTPVKGISVGSFTVKKMPQNSMMRLPQGICCSIQFPELCTEQRQFYRDIPCRCLPATRLVQIYCKTLLFFGDSACKRAIRRSCSSIDSSGSPTCCRRQLAAGPILQDDEPQLALIPHLSREVRRSR
jgi:hypothetical protein